MLGEKLGSESGRVTGRRVLPGEGFRFMKLEVSFESETDVLGVRGQNVGTYTIVERGPGQMYAEGQGIIMTEDGEGVIWNGHGVAQMAQNGDMSVGASIALQTSSEKLARLNSVLVLVEHHAHADGHLHSTLWEWTGASH